MPSLWILLIGALFYFPHCLTGELIHRPVVNIYLQPVEDTEITSQAVYGSVVKIVEPMGDWSKIRTADGTEGWVLSHQLTTNPSYENSAHLRPVKSLFAHIYRVTDTTPYPPLLTIPYGSKVKLEKTVDMGERWVSMELLSGEKAWIQRGDVDFSPACKSLGEVLTFSQQFLGLPYTWGGTSSYGFDCSGFIQMLFQEMGLQLPRNARDQAACDLFIPVGQKDLQPGDLIFFGESKITHVGLYLGQDAFIHAGVRESPKIMISHIQKGKYTFHSARRINPLMAETYRVKLFTE
jgi:hypothetical protein